MKTLFMHGKKRQIHDWQIRSIEQAGLEAFTLKMQYPENPKKPFLMLRNYILANQIEFLIGRSHGGFLGYWLAEELGLPCLLINPNLSPHTQKQITPTTSKRDCSLCVNVLGMSDEIVNPYRTREFLEKDHSKNPSKILKIKMLENIGHHLNEKIFSKMVNFTLTEIQKLHSSI